jgi:hypothetical protein
MADTEPIAEARRLAAISKLVHEKIELVKKKSLSHVEKRRLQDIDADLTALGPPHRTDEK